MRKAQADSIVDMFYSQGNIQTRRQIGLRPNCTQKIMQKNGGHYGGDSRQIVDKLFFADPSSMCVYLSISHIYTVLCKKPMLYLDVST